jgi:hypothetical protein
MTELEEWYHANCLRVERLGVDLSVPSSKPVQHIDGKCGRYMFRFIDRGDRRADIEIMDATSGAVMKHNLDDSTTVNSVYDRVIEFIVELAQ